MKRQIHFYVAMYLRLSRDDQDRDGISRSESNSIGSQRELIRLFLKEQKDMELYDSYVDDGFSGSNFQRPEFERMMEDVKTGRVNCIVVKDDCVIIERNTESPKKCGFCGVRSVFWPKTEDNKSAGQRKEGRTPADATKQGFIERASLSEKSGEVDTNA